MMNNLALVRKTVADLGGDITETAVLFYQRLFELEPELKPLFKNDPEVQRTKFLDTLTFIIEGLDTPEAIIQSVKRLGIRHHQYGVQDVHYQTAGMALFWALEQSLGGAFTNEVRVAWQQTYYLLAEIMQEANKNHIS